MARPNLEQYLKEENSKPNLEEIKKSENPIGRLIDFYIDMKRGIGRRSYFKNESETLKREKFTVGNMYNWFAGRCSFPLKYLKGVIGELQIPLEEVIAVNKGKDPFKADLKEFKKANSPICKLIDFYIDLNHGVSRENYLRKDSETVKKEKLNTNSLHNWFAGSYTFPLKYLKSFVDELQIPLEEVIAVNKGKDPFKADLKEFKKANSPICKLIDFYIDLNHGVSRENYLRKDSETVKKEKLNIHSIIGGFSGSHPFSLKYLKSFVDELQIPLEEVIAVNKGKDPFKADLEEFKKAKNPLGKLVEFYIDLNHGMDRKKYLKKESKTVKQEKFNADTAISWFKGANLFPLKYLKSFVDELQIPLEEVIAVNKGKDPFKADLEEFKKANSPIGKLLDFYIDLKYGVSRITYLRKDSETAKQDKYNADTISSWLTGRTFPLKYLKSFVDELQIPYKEVNCLIEGDIEKGTARSGNVVIDTNNELVLSSLEYYAEQYRNGSKERPAKFYQRQHKEFEKKHRISTRQIYRSLK